MTKKIFYTCELCKSQYSRPGVVPELKSFNKFNMRICPSCAKPKKKQFTCNFCNRVFFRKVTILDKIELKCSFCKGKDTLYEKYGVTHNLQIPEVRDHRDKTFIEKYGGNPFSNKEIQAKSKLTLLTKYGRTDVGQFGTQEHTDALKEKYGVDHASKSDVIKQKIKNTNLARYGETVGSKADTVKEKQKITNLNKYGSISPLQNNDVKIKTEQTLLQKYGVDHFSKSEEFKQLRWRKVKYSIVDMTIEICKKSEPHNDNYLYFDSIPEAEFYKQCVIEGKSIKREPCFFKYMYDKVEHHYFPDFEVDGQLFEIKGKQFLKADGSWQNPYDHQLDDFYEAKHQCALANNVTIIYV